MSKTIRYIVKSRKASSAALLATLAFLSGYPANSTADTERMTARKDPLEERVLEQADKLARVGLASTIDGIDREGIGEWDHDNVVPIELENDLRSLMNPAPPSREQRASEIWNAMTPTYFTTCTS